MNTGLAQRTVLVTGSSSGIGRATAIAFGQEGARVAITYHTNRAGAEETAAAVDEAGGEPLIVQYDLNDSESIDAAVQSVVDRWNAIHVLVNNAVPTQYGTSPETEMLFEDTPRTAWQGMLRSAVEGAYQTVQTVLPAMRTAEWGRIVTLSSNVVEEGLPDSSAYTVAKAGLHGLTTSLAVDLGDTGILSNVVMPGLTLTEGNVTQIPPEIRDQEANRTPTNRLTTPEDVANVVVFLGSEANTHVNGATIPVTGGV